MLRDFLFYKKRLGISFGKRLLLLLLILVLHLIFIAVFNLKQKRYVEPDSVVFDSMVSHINFILPEQPRRHYSPRDNQVLTLKNPPLDIITLPEFEIEKSAATSADYADLDLKPFITNAQPSSGVKGDFSNVFDPRIRKKLAEIRPHSSETKKHDYFYLPDGSIAVEVGDGQCIKSMPKIDPFSRGTIWSTSTFKCGKSDSEKFMENVQRDVDAHSSKKH